MLWLKNKKNFTGHLLWDTVRYDISLKIFFMEEGAE